MYRYCFIKEVVIDFAQVAIQRDDFQKNNDMFNRLLSRDHVAVVCLCENLRTGSRVIVANAHICWEPAFCDVKLIQTGIMIDSLKGIAEWFAQMPPPPPKMNGDGGDDVKIIPPKYAEGRDIPLIVCGDYNSLPGSGVYNFLADGRVPGDHPDFMNFVYGKFTADGLRHDFGLRDAYCDLDEFPITNYVPTFQGHIDYIWYNPSALSINKVLSGIDKTYLSKYVGFPNAHFPSEYVPFIYLFSVHTLIVSSPLQSYQHHGRVPSQETARLIIRTPSHSFPSLLSTPTLRPPQPSNSLHLLAPSQAG